MIRTRVLAALTAVVALVVACQTDVHPAPIVGSSYRIDNDKPDPESELFLDVFTTAEECARAKIDETDICRPMVDRAAGEVHLSFMFRDRDTSQPFFIPLSRDQIMVRHDRARQESYELIPHNPRTSGQLYVVIIDGSSSMYDNDGERIRKVNRALLSREVADAFFPGEDGKTGVLLMQFSNDLHQLGGGEPKVITNKAEYRQLVKDHLLTRSGGFTHLYGAVRDGMTKLLVDKDVRQFIASRNAQPTLIVLTDGFNNEEGSDTCGSNVSRLTETLDVVKKARRAGGTAKPMMYTVGLGKRYRPGEKPEGLNQSVTPSGLCGKYLDERIDSNLEVFGIDHISLAWLAEAGGGVSFVKQNYKGLAEVFLTAAAKRYEWFELKYRTPDPIYHRQSFDVSFSLLQGYRSSTEVSIHPNPWFDGPTGKKPPGAAWTELTSLNHTLTVLMPVLGILVFLNYLGAATFNARRAVFRRAKPRRRN
ncbi:MAG: VWA domain-containing protein [Alphaproteobacteria bacterium]|nr:VWA domain-containing protein [Alphaproteobacteria bacterium]